MSDRGITLHAGSNRPSGQLAALLPIKGLDALNAKVSRIAAGAGGKRRTE